MAHTTFVRRRRSYLRSAFSRRGAILVLSALLMVAMVGMLAFALDVGYMFHVRAEMQRSVDSGAMAGAGVLVNGQPAAEAEVYKFVALNKAGGKKLDSSKITVQFGQWDSVARQFTAGGNQVPSAIKVFATNPSQPFFFGRLFGMQSFTSQARATVTYLPRDIMLALDYSGSMCEDSQLGAIGKLGRSWVEDNLKTMYQELGSPKYGKMKFKPEYISSTNDATVLSTLGLNGVPYPYPGGSWNDYVNFVQSDGDVSAAGYKKYYGYLTWMQYLQTQQQSNSDTPDLWKTSEQPLSAVKDGVDLMLAYLQANSTNDRVGFSLYTAADNTAKLENPLTKNYAGIATLARQRQAGHYVGGTNIYDGMKTARLELQNNGRVGAKKMMVLMTDGKANMPYVGNPSALVLAEAQLAAAAQIAVVAISLGSGADTSIMQSVADITGGKHFVIEGGQSVADVEDQLKDVFEQVANTRPFKLVE